jgi:hypothetical protein
MTFQQRRVHLIAFRVTDDEHALLQQMCKLRGRTLSDLARTELLKALSPDADSQRTEVQMADLKARVRELEILVMPHHNPSPLDPQSNPERTGET